MPPLRTKRPYTRPFLCALIVFLIGMAVLYLGLDLKPSLDSAGEVAWRLAVTLAMPALVTGFMARRAARPWSMGKIISIFLLAFAVIAAIQVLGYSNGAVILKT
jgi:hypothetical protein